MASVGINGAVINNVNVKDQATYMITEKYFDKLREMSEIFAGYGIRFFMSLNYAAPVELGELDSADPLDENVIAWWKKRMEIVYEAIPLLGGFLIKADSEGRPGPFTYGRNHADGANLLQRPSSPTAALLSGAALSTTADRTGATARRTGQDPAMTISWSWTAGSGTM